MDIEKRLELLTRPPIEEVITHADLRRLLEEKKRPVAYDGFEPSGILHLASGPMRAMKIQDFLDAKVHFKLFIADWFAWLNNKLGGDLDLIQEAGKYFTEGWKACGVDIKKAEICWASDNVADPEYWKLVIDVAKRTTIPRMIRCSQIMGRKESEMQYTSQVLYPAMQAADPFYLGADICQLGMDQRKCTVLSREIGPKIGKWAPVCMHHHLLLGLQGTQKMNILEAKMSKSKPMSGIYIHDSEEQISAKIRAAHCLPKEIEGNPLMELCEYLIFPKFGKLTVVRPTKYGGDLQFDSYDELAKAYSEGLHPLDLKNAVDVSVNKLVSPIRKHFEKGKAKGLYEIVSGATITR